VLIHAHSYYCCRWKQLQHIVHTGDAAYGRNNRHPRWLLSSLTHAAPAHGPPARHSQTNIITTSPQRIIEVSMVIHAAVTARHGASQAAKRRGNQLCEWIRACRSVWGEDMVTTTVAAISVAGVMNCGSLRSFCSCDWADARCSICCTHSAYAAAVAQVA
jgi:hypothetical protein